MKDGGEVVMTAAGDRWCIILGYVLETTCSRSLSFPQKRESLNFLLWARYNFDTRMYLFC